jgi:protein with PEP-CTERM/exosortase system signal
MRFGTKQFGLAALFAAGMALNANALLLTPGSAGWQGTSPSNPNADGVETITGTAAQLTQVYKYNAGGSESGGFASSYSGTYTPTLTAAQDLTISYGSGSVISGTAIYLLVKDSNLSPKWYIFDISSWDGKEQIKVDGYYPQQLGISYASIFSGQGGAAKVADAGSSLALLGLGLTALGLVRRKFGPA